MALGGAGSGVGGYETVLLETLYVILVSLFTTLNLPKNDCAMVLFKTSQNLTLELIGI